MRWILIHSPLVGPLTWKPVGEVLERKGFSVSVPKLDNDRPDGSATFWEHHADGVMREVLSAYGGEPCVLVAHSGAGVLIPAVAAGLPGRIRASLFVDAILPEDGKSRLDLFDTPEEAEAFRQMAVDGFLPGWTVEELVPVIPDDELRRQFVRQLRPVPLAVYEEPVPVPPDWPNHPCAYLKFTPAYDRMAERAGNQGWPVDILSGGHFHMLADPEETARRLIGLAERLNVL